MSPSPESSKASEAEFDAYADEYGELHRASVAISGEEPAYFHEYKIKDIAHEHQQRNDAARGAVKILDFGAGTGGTVPYVGKHFPQAELTCLDVSQESLDVAKQHFGDAAKYVHFDGTTIPFPSESFDIAYAMCVFHHIDHDLHVALLRELRRVVKPGGSLFVFEHNPFNPLTVHIVNNCPFDENAHLITAPVMKQRLRAAGFDEVAAKYRLFFPNVLRALRPIEKLMTWLPLGGQYYAMARKRCA